MRNDVILNDTLAICVRYCTLESVTYLDGNLSTCVRSLGLHENYDPVIEILGTYTPFNTDLGGIFSRRISFQISNGDDSNLVGSSVTERLQLLLKFIDCFSEKIAARSLTSFGGFGRDGTATAAAERTVSSSATIANRLIFI